MSDLQIGSIEFSSSQLEGRVMALELRISDLEATVFRLQTQTQPKKKTAKVDSKNFVKPTIEDVRAYCEERKNSVDPEKFMAHYESNGWKVGRNPMKNWKACVITWEKGTRDRWEKGSDGKGGYGPELDHDDPRLGEFVQ